MGIVLLAGIAGTVLVIEVDLLSDVAALRLAPDNIETGRAEIERLVRPLRRRLGAINAGRSVIGTIGAIAAVAGFAIVAGSPPHSSEWGAQALAVGGATTVMMSWLGGRLIQRRRRFVAKRPYDTPLPPEIETLLTDLAAGRLRAVMSKGYGPVSTSALRANDGQLFDTEIAPGTFGNRFAPILLLANPKDYAALWMPWGGTLDRPIYVVKAPDEEQREPSPSEPKIEMHWIAKIPSDRFADWNARVQQRGPWDVLTQIEVGQVLDAARRRAESDAQAGKKFNVNGFARNAKTPRLSAETIRKLIAKSGEHDYDWVRKSAEAAQLGSDQVG